MATPQVLIGDAQRLFSGALATALSRETGLRVVEQRADTWIEAGELMERLEPDVAILDYWMPDAELLETTEGGTPQTRALRSIVERVRSCRIIVLAGAFSLHHLRSSLESGAAAFLPKNLTVREVAEAIRMVHAGAPLVYSEELFRLTERLEKRLAESNETVQRFATLSPPELEVLIRRGLGHSAEAISRDLFVSRATVNRRIHSILNKTASRTIAEALATARRAGLLQS